MVRNLLDKLRVKDFKGPETLISALIDIMNTIDERLAQLDSVLSRPIPSRVRGVDYSKFDILTLVRMFIDHDDAEALEHAVRVIMRSVECSFCRVMASAAYMEAKMGNTDKAKEYAKELYKFLTEPVEKT